MIRREGRGDRGVVDEIGADRDDELAAELARGPLAQSADNLIETVLARGAPDNVSLIIIKLL